MAGEGGGTPRAAPPQHHFTPSIERGPECGSRSAMSMCGHDDILCSQLSTRQLLVHRDACCHVSRVMTLHHPHHACHDQPNSHVCNMLNTLHAASHPISRCGSGSWDRSGKFCCFVIFFVVCNIFIHCLRVSAVSRAVMNNLSGWRLGPQLRCYQAL